MASTSAAETATWHEGDTCLAPDPRDGILREATFRRLSSTSEHPDATAWVTFTDHSTDGVEESVPVSKLKRPGANCFTQEKPFFPGSVISSGMCVPLELNNAGVKVPYTINRYLRDYQREGIKFLYNNYIRSRGCILGDDMGLGKTVQVIGFLAALLHKKGTREDIDKNRPHFLQSQALDKQSKPNTVFLIVAPLSVLYNWKDELDTWGHFQCVVVHGLRKEEELTRIKKGRAEIALTTYETLRLCLDQFNSVDWSAVVVDEAHKIKNPNSQITQAMKELRSQIRIGLTGTILQNNLEELWCVMDWALPGCLGSIGHFRNKFSDPIEQGQKHSATKRALATGRKTVRALVRKICHSFLRRTKALIKEQMPKKDDRVVYCSLTDFQHTVYQTVLKSEDVTLLLRSSEKCDCQSGHTRRRCCYRTNSEGVEMKKLYFTYLAILRKVANHVALLQSSAGTSKNQKKYVSAICQKVFEKFPDFVHRCKDEAFEALSDPMYSGKMKVLQKLLKYYLQRKDKLLVFSLSTKLLDILESYCMAEGLDYSRLDGNSKSKERVQIVKEFNSSSHINICLVSTMAGGLGLNFVGANVVVLFDPTWNPANDLQAIDRAYRIGQCRDVTVLRLISLGTVEEVIYLRQLYKQQLHSSVVANESARRYFEAVQGDGGHKGELFGIKNLFRLQTRGTCLTRQILEREGQVEAGVTTTRTHTVEEKEEEAKGLGEPEKDSGIAASKCNKAPKKNREASKLSRGVLDFSSDSDDDEKVHTGVKKLSDPNALDATAATTSTPGRMTLLQHDFSKLLQRIKGSPDSVERDSSNIEDSSTDEDDKEKPNRTSPNAVKDSALPSRLERSNLEILSDSDQDRSDDVAKKVSVNASSAKHKRLKTFARVAHLFESYSDESEDLDIEIMTSSRKRALVLAPKRAEGKANRNTKRQRATIRAKGRFTEDIESCTSSEDEHSSVKKPRPSPMKEPHEVQFTLTKQGLTTPTKPALKPKTNLTSPQSKNGSIDTVLGGVQGVAYIHSNQKVVGGSSAEERISRAAVRDVFERHMFSQMPANHLIGTQESLSESPPQSPPIPTRTTTRLETPNVDHPVTFTNRSVHQTRHTTFIIGETPQSICRQQLEEMSSKFHFPSVGQFAREVLKNASTQRLTWLRQFYASLDHPDLADTVTNHFPTPVSTKTTSSTTPHVSPSGSVPRVEATKPVAETSPCKKSRRMMRYCDAKSNEKRQKQKKDRFEDIPSPEADWPEEKGEISSGFKRRKRGCVTNFTNLKDGGPGLDQTSSRGPSSNEPAAVLSHTDRDSVPEMIHGPSSSISKSTIQETKGEQEQPEDNTKPLTPSNPNSLLTDLIGDTSILDVLFKPKRSSPKTPNTNSRFQTHTKASQSKVTPSCSSAPISAVRVVSSPKTSLKKASKDFWDILQDGNEERWNRLTDPAEVERVCVNTTIAARAHYKEEQSKGLWKTNEKFLWKK